MKGPSTALWDIDIREHGMVDHSDWSGTPIVIVIKRNGKVVAQIFPCNAEPGIQICSDALDLRNPIYSDSQPVMFPVPWVAFNLKEDGADGKGIG